MAGSHFGDLLEELQVVVMRNASHATAASIGLSCKRLFREFRKLNISWKQFKISLCEDGIPEQIDWARRELRMTFGHAEAEAAARCGHKALVADLIQNELIRRKTAKSRPNGQSGIHFSSVSDVAAARGHVEVVKSIATLTGEPNLYYFAFKAMIEASNLPAIQSFENLILNASDIPAADISIVSKSISMGYKTGTLLALALRSADLRTVLYFHDRIIEEGRESPISPLGYSGAALNPHTEVLLWLRSKINAPFSLEDAKSAARGGIVANFKAIVAVVDPSFSHVDTYIDEAIRSLSLDIIPLLLSLTDGNTSAYCGRLMHEVRPLPLIPKKTAFLHKLLDLFGADVLPHLNATDDPFQEYVIWDAVDILFLERIHKLGFKFTHLELEIYISKTPWLSNSEAVLKFMMEKGAKTNMDYFHFAVSRNYRRSFLEFLLQNGWKPASPLPYILDPRDQSAEPFDSKERYFTLRSLNVPFVDRDLLFYHFVEAAYPIEVIDDFVTNHFLNPIPWEKKYFANRLARTKSVEVLKYFLKLSNGKFPINMYLVSIDAALGDVFDTLYLTGVRYLEYMTTLSPETLPESKDSIWKLLFEHIIEICSEHNSTNYEEISRSKFYEILDWFDAQFPLRNFDVRPFIKDMKELQAVSHLMKGLLRYLAQKDLPLSEEEKISFFAEPKPQAPSEFGGMQMQAFMDLFFPGGGFGGGGLNDGDGLNPFQ